MDKAAQLQTVLGRLSSPQAAELARAVELDRALGRVVESMPSEAILEALRPMLRIAKPPRVPTLQRLICVGFEDFLTDHDDDPRLEGLIPRASLSRWWQAIEMIAGDEVRAFETRLREQLGAVAPHLETLQHEAWEAAARWSAAVVAELANSKPPLALRKLLPAPAARDVDVIAHVLAIAKPLNAAMKTLLRISARLNLLEERRITDLAPDCITLLKKEYLALSESHGMDARFLALAVLNRLQHSHQILRLGRALSWKPNDTLVANTEFFCVGARLIGEVERDARAILLQMPRRGPLPSPHALGASLVHYLDESEGVLKEIGVRRDSPWGIALLKSRTNIADALDESFLDRCAALILALLPQVEYPGHGPDLSAPPSRATIGLANEAASFLKLLTQRGERHGFAKTAHEAINTLAEEVDARISDLCGTVRTTPDRAAVIEAQARAVAELYGELFDHERSTVLMRQITLALHAPAL
ncbi:MAG TPA: hypothetical protein VG328_24595 [Stellaceae bacterium]|jgi:hypothetical protein|nr:hypothetical protein [Stellaceae bacterium]